MENAFRASKRAGAESTGALHRVQSQLAIVADQDYHE
jgi:hypothetical protein